MQKEAGERRDFLPPFVASLHRLGARVVLEHDYGAGMGLSAGDYLQAAPGARFAPHEETYQQDIVIELRCPTDSELKLLRPGACLISMLHYPTRPGRVDFLRSLEIDAVSLDSIKDDNGRRLIENLRSVAWNGLEAAFQTLRRVYPAPGFEDPGRPPIQVALLGAGAVGSHAVQAAVRYGDDALRQRLVAAGVPGVQVTVVDHDVTGRAEVMRAILSRSDVLVDATQRPDPSQPVVPNDWIEDLPEHAVIVDLSVDPYDCSPQARSVKGVEGVPQGDLDQYVFAPDDPAYDRLPACVNTRHRRRAVSCYSWPGVHPKACMEVYGRQLQPVVRTLIEKGGLPHINPAGRFFERAIARAQLSRWPAH